MFLPGQSISDWEQQLERAGDAKEKMMLNDQLANEWLSSDTRQSIAYAKAARLLDIFQHGGTEDTKEHRALSVIN